MTFILDENLKEYATKRQWEVLTTWQTEGSQRKAAEKIGCAKAAIHSAKAAVLKKAVMQGYSPDHDMINPAPEGFRVKGTSTLYDDLGNKKIQWVKTTADIDKQKEMIAAVVSSMAQEVTPVKPISFDGNCDQSLLNKYIFTDSHVGMTAWHREGGSNWDLKIAEDVLTGAFLHAIENAPKAKVGYICQLGDFMHFDGLSAITPTSGHVLDADGRFGKMVEFAIRILRRIIDNALLKHEQVHVVMAEGNHDLASSVWLRKLFKLLYENEPRVTVDDSELPYYAFKFGKVMLTCHHGHLKKFSDLDRQMAAQFPKIWGETEFRYCDTGHYHHREVKEDYGMTREMHRTLAAKDAYASRGGYHAGRDMQAVTYHSEYGEVGRLSVSPEMFMNKNYDK